MAQHIQFVNLTQEEYDNLVKNPGRLYFTSDTHRIYKGDDLYAGSDLDELEFGELESEQLIVDGKHVSLEGHTHVKDDIEDFDHTHDYSQLTGVAKSQHRHTASEIDGMDFSPSNHKHTVDEIQGWDETSLKFSNLNAESLKVNGTDVSLEGHKHGFTELIDDGTLNANSIEANELNVSSQLTLGGEDIATKTYVNQQIEVAIGQVLTTEF